MDTQEIVAYIGVEAIIGGTSDPHSSLGGGTQKFEDL